MPSRNSWQIAVAHTTTSMRSRSGPTCFECRRDELFYAYTVDTQVIVIAETIDAVRALTRSVEDGTESIAVLMRRWISDQLSSKASRD
jgi:hypothetical protein